MPLTQEQRAELKEKLNKIKINNRFLLFNGQLEAKVKASEALFAKKQLGSKKIKRVMNKQVDRKPTKYIPEITNKEFIDDLIVDISNVGKQHTLEK